MKILKMFVPLFIICSVLSSCSRIVNPYSSEFSCPSWERGKCVGIQQAYQESLNATSGQGNYTVRLEENISSADFHRARESYLQNLYERLDKFLTAPEKQPLVIPPKVVRMLVLPYESGEGKVFMGHRYVYIIVDDYKWLFDTSVNPYLPEMFKNDDLR